MDGLEHNTPIYSNHTRQQTIALRVLGMSWGVKLTCFEAPGVSLGGSGISIEGVRILGVKKKNKDNLSPATYFRVTKGNKQIDGNKPHANKDGLVP